MDCNVLIPEEIALFEEAFDIAWSVLERSADLGQLDEASLFLRMKCLAYAQWREEQAAPL